MGQRGVSASLEGVATSLSELLPMGILGRRLAKFFPPNKGLIVGQLAREEGKPEEQFLCLSCSWRQHQPGCSQSSTGRVAQVAQRNWTKADRLSFQASEHLTPELGLVEVEVVGDEEQQVGETGCCTEGGPVGPPPVAGCSYQRGTEASVERQACPLLPLHGGLSS